MADAPAPAPAPPPGARNSIAWERERSFVALKDTLLDVLLKPGETFRGAHPNVSVLPALGFTLIFGCLTYGLNFGLRRYGAAMVFGHVLPSLMPSWALLLFPLRLAASVFVNAALLHLALMITGANPLGFGASVRISAYATGATSLFSVVPTVGHWAGLLMLFVVEVTAIRRMHKTTGGKAAFAALAPIVLRWGFFGGLALIGIYSIASLFR